MFSNFYEVYSVFSSGPSPSLSFTFCDVTNTQGSFARLLQATRILSLLRRVLSNNQEGGEPNIDGRFSHCSPVSLLTSIPVSSVTTIINAESPPRCSLHISFVCQAEEEVFLRLRTLTSWISLLPLAPPAPISVSVRAAAFLATRSTVARDSFQPLIFGSRCGGTLGGKKRCGRRAGAAGHPEVTRVGGSGGRGSKKKTGR